MTQLNTTTRNIIVVALIVAIALVYFYLDFKPKYAQIGEQKATITQQAQTYDDLKRVAEQKPLYLALQKQIQQRLRGVELTADPRAYIPSYLKQIEDLAKRDGLTVTTVVPANTPAPTPVPSGAPASAVSNIAPINAAANAAGGEAMHATQVNKVGQQVSGPTPAGQTPVPSSSGPVTAPGPKLPAGNAARAAAMSYLSQSFTQVPVNMEVQGTYAQMQRFLRDLNKFPKLIGVSDVSLSPASGAGVGDTPTLHITLPIVAYRLSPNAQVTPAPAASPAAGQ
jgi:Tfp pilus assembly protein PilO